MGADKTENLIRKLSKDSRVPFWKRSLLGFYGLWIFVSSLYFLGVLWFTGRLTGGQSLSFFLGLGGLALLFWFLSFLALRSGLPGRQLRGWVAWGSIGLFFMWIVWVFLRPSICDHEAIEWAWRLPSSVDWQCAMDVSQWSLFPLVLFIFCLRFLAPTQLNRTGSLVFLTAFLIGAMLVEFFCGLADPLHMIYGHLGVILVAGLLGFVLGPKLMRW